MSFVSCAVTPDASEAEIRAYVRRTLEDCAPGGHFIPSITYGLPGAVFPQVDAAIDAEIAAWNGETHLHGARRAAVVEACSAGTTDSRPPSSWASWAGSSWSPAR